MDLRDLLAHRNCFVNEIRVTLWSHARWLYLATEGGKIKFYSIRGSLRDSYQLPSILLIFEVSYKTNVSLRAVQWQGFRIRWKIATHCSTQLRFVEQCVAIFHLMRNPWPSHGSAWNICILYHGNISSFFDLWENTFTAMPRTRSTERRFSADATKYRGTSLYNKDLGTSKVHYKWYMLWIISG